MKVEKEVALIERIARRAFVFATKMIVEANHRDDVMEGDPKVGGHPAACSSCIHVMSALHLGVRQPQDWFAVKPHGSPVDHSLNYLQGFFHEPMGRRWLDSQESADVMMRLRKFSQEGEPVFQSYHAEADPDGNIYFPSGSVGIPPVVSMYMALAYRYASDHGIEVPKDAHFWSLIGDSEFREGSLMEAMPDAAERELGNVTWIIDYNRQNLDGARIPNKRGIRGTDADRIERLAVANGWDVIQCRHGRARQAAFARFGGETLRNVLENAFSDFEFQMLLLKKDGSVVRDRLISLDKKCERALAEYDDEAVYKIFADLGGHDVAVMLDALRRSKLDPINPTIVIAHTIKGWGLSSYAAPGNHNALPSVAEIDKIIESEGISVDQPFTSFAEDSEEGRFLAERRAYLRAGQEAIWALKDRNDQHFAGLVSSEGIPESLGLNLKLLPLVHTQYVWGQLAAKLIRIGTTHEMQRSGKEPDRPLADAEARWGPAADLVLTMAPDVGTSTNINPAMDDRIYGPEQEDHEEELGLRDRRRPQLAPHEEDWSRHIRFEIAEANCVSAVGAFGKFKEYLGVPFLPIMTIYDFFIKRAFDQLYYNLYWSSSFICVGTPSGVTLAPEGAQHSWKSDIAMPNIIIWEPFFAIEMDWILSDSVRRHYLGDNKGRTGVVIRAVTRAFKQAQMMDRLKSAKRFEGQDEATILEATRLDALQGAYYLIDYRGFEGYESGENVVNIFTMGAMGTEAIAASDRLRAEGIYANVIVVTCGDLLCGNLGHGNGYQHLKQGLGINGDLHLTQASGAIALEDHADVIQVAGRRVPLVAIVDGEPGILDNLGSIVGVKAETLGIRKASKCGRPIDVYKLHKIDGDNVYEACGRVLTETALENVQISQRLLTAQPPAVTSGEGMWPPRT